jgi:hypothetical protein
MNREEQRKKIQKIIAKAWADEAFKQKLLSNPLETLREQGVSIPPGIDVRVVESTADVYYFVLPPKPEGMDIQEAVDRIAASPGALSPLCTEYTHCG